MALEPGIYRLHWKQGGDSLAVVGMGDLGQRWYATPVDNVTRHYLQLGGRNRREAREYRVGRTDWRRVAWADPVACVDVET